MKKKFFYILTIFLNLSLFSGLGETYAQAPVIRSFSPEKAWYGTDVYIQGSGFTSNKEDLEVKFGAGTAKIIESTATAIRVQVPAGATYAPVTVLHKTTGLTAWSARPFMLTFGGKENAAPQFGAPQKLPLNTGIRIYDVCTCDLDGDGRNDLAGSNEGGTSITTYLNNSSSGTIGFPAAFPGRTEINAGKATKFISCADLDGDGKPDLVLTGANISQEVVFLRNTSTSGANGSPGIVSFGAFQLLTIASKDWQKPLIHDLDGDGKPDLIFTNATDNQVYVFRNTSVNGSISFDPAFLSFTISGASTRGLRIKDMSQDGLPDITVSNYYGSKVYFFINNSTAGNIAFEPVVIFQAGSGITNHEIEDMDGDGKKDLITLDYLSNKVNLYLNNSTGTSVSFGEAKTFPTSGNLPVGLETGDLNGDQKPDLLIGLNGTSVANIFTNTGTPGNPNFTVSVLSSPENGKFSNVKISDLDGDAKPDVVAADNAAAAFYVFRNAGCIAPVVNKISSGDNTTLFTVQTPPAANGSPTLSYQWFKNGVPAGTDYKLEDIGPGDYTVEIVTTGCGTLTSAPFSQNNCLSDLGNPAFGAIPPVCEGSSFTLTAAPAVSGATYQWTNEISGLTETTTTNSITIENADPELHSGTYTLRIEAACAIELRSGALVINPVPVPSITADEILTVCQGDSRVLKAAEGFASYQWKKDGVNIPSANSSSFTATESGTYSAVVKNGSGCSGETATLSFVATETLQPTFESPPSACLNQPLQFMPDFELPANTPVRYAWDFGDGTGSDQKAPTHTYTAGGEGTYTVSLNLQYGTGNCSGTFSRTIRVHDILDIEMEAASTSLCAGDSVKVQITGDVTVVNWSNGKTGSFTYAKSGGTLSADITTLAGCTLSKSIELNAWPAFIPEIIADKTTAGPGESVQLEATAGVAWLWEPAESLDNPHIANPVAFPDKTTTYRLTATGENGCTAVSEITIEVENSFRVLTPKLFVPASDQFWKVENIEYYQEVSLTILNKLGRVVFEAAPYQNDWDGTERGNNLTNGVFYYVFKDASGNVLKTGSITLIR